MTKMTKVAQAKTIVESNPEASRSELVQMFMAQLGMSKAGATTYGYNLAKGAAKRVKKVVEGAVKAPKKVRQIVINEEATKVLHDAELVVPEVRTEEEYTKEEAVFDAIAAKLAAKRERDAARKREKRAAEKALRETLVACAA
jgi:hypothetical protein